MLNFWQLITPSNNHQRFTTNRDCHLIVAKLDHFSCPGVQLTQEARSMTPPSVVPPQTTKRLPGRIDRVGAALASSRAGMLHPSCNGGYVSTDERRLPLSHPPTTTCRPEIGVKMISKALFIEKREGFVNSFCICVKWSASGYRMLQQTQEGHVSDFHISSSATLLLETPPIIENYLLCWAEEFWTREKKRRMLLGERVIWVFRVDLRWCHILCFSLIFDSIALVAQDSC